jgi:hypothetical protein
MTDLVVQGEARQWVLGTTAFAHDLRIYGIVREFVVTASAPPHNLYIQGVVREFVMAPFIGTTEEQYSVTVVT